MKIGNEVEGHYNFSSRTLFVTEEELEDFDAVLDAVVQVAPKGISIIVENPESVLREGFQQKLHALYHARETYNVTLEMKALPASKDLSSLPSITLTVTADSLDDVFYLRRGQDQVKFLRLTYGGPFVLAAPIEEFRLTVPADFAEDIVL